MPEADGAQDPGIRHSAKPLVALVWHAHLSMRMAFKIQTFVMKLPARELLPARGGVNFPLSKEEMRWHLSYFDIAALKVGLSRTQAGRVRYGRHSRCQPLVRRCAAKPASAKPRCGAIGAALDLEFLRR